MKNPVVIKNQSISLIIAVYLKLHEAKENDAFVHIIFLYLLDCFCNVAFQNFGILFKQGCLIHWTSQFGLERISRPMMRSSRETGKSC